MCLPNISQNNQGPYPVCLETQKARNTSGPIKAIYSIYAKGIYNNVYMIL